MTASTLTVPAVVVLLTTPKSASLTAPSLVIRMLAPLMLLWMRPWLCRYGTQDCQGPERHRQLCYEVFRKLSGLFENVVQWPVLAESGGNKLVNRQVNRHMSERCVAPCVLQKYSCVFKKPLYSTILGCYTHKKWAHSLTRRHRCIHWDSSASQSQNADRWLGMEDHAQLILMQTTIWLSLPFSILHCSTVFSLLSQSLQLPYWVYLDVPSRGSEQALQPDTMTYHRPAQTCLCPMSLWAVTCRWGQKRGTGNYWTHIVTEDPHRGV